MLANAVEASSNGVVVSDPNLPDAPIIYVNPAFERITGYSSKQVLGRNCRFLQGSDCDQPDLEDMRTALGEGRECRAVLRNYRKDGTLFWNELYVSPVYGEDGRVVNFIGIQNDVTERIGTQEALREGEELLRLATESGGVGIIRFGAAGSRVTCSGVCYEIFEFLQDVVDSTREELLEKVHPEDLEIVLRAWDLALSEGVSYEIEHRLVRNNGEVRWVVQRGSVYREAQGNLEQVVGTVQDITARKAAEEEEARRRMSVMVDASRLLSSSLDYEETIESITSLFVPGIAEWCFLHIEEDGVIDRRAAVHADPEMTELIEELGEKRSNSEVPAAIAEVFQNARAALFSEMTEADLEGLSYDEESLETLRRLDPKSCVIVPLSAAGRVIGVLTLASSNADRTYDSEDLSQAAGLANRCALALENARLYREQSYVTHTLQRGLLPESLPEIPGVEVGVEYFSVGEETEVGGDFYDLIDTHYDGWLCILGDVSGKGARAAVVTALIMYTLRAIAFQGDRPSAMFAALNEAMVSHDAAPRFCTAVCARLEPEEAPEKRIKLTLARAGHPPPLLLREGSIEEIGEPGRVIGVFEELDLDDYTTHLVPGDVLVLYTDGVIEARRPDGEFFGEERLKSLLCPCADLDARSIASRVREVVLEHKGGGDPSDDVAILVLRVTGDDE
jgi:PAS domain S-box-containing protein